MKSWHLNKLFQNLLWFGLQIFHLHNFSTSRMLPARRELIHHPSLSFFSLSLWKVSFNSHETSKIHKSLRYPEVQHFLYCEVITCKLKVIVARRGTKQRFAVSRQKYLKDCQQHTKAKTMYWNMWRGKSLVSRGKKGNPMHVVSIISSKVVTGRILSW